jgi:GntR family transcriptional regulator
MTDTVTPVSDDERLDEADPRPLWEQLSARLRDRILSGELNGRMPAEWQIAAQYGVSRDTVRRALEKLREEGLIMATRGRGTFTVPRAEGPPE